MKLISLSCPKCGANLDDIEEGREFIFCSYCGNKIMLNNENEYVIRSIDEAQIKQTESSERIALKELEIQEKSKSLKVKVSIILGSVSIILMLIGLLTVEDIAIVGFLGIVIVMYIWIFGTIGPNKERAVPHNPDDICVSKEMCKHRFEDINHEVLKEIYCEAGFTKVKTISLKDVGLLSLKRVTGKMGAVEEVRINGSEDFNEGDYFSKNSNVIISYHGE